MEAIENAFRKIGSRVRFGTLVPEALRRFNRTTGRWERTVSHRYLSVDIARDRKGEFFQVRTNGTVDLHVMQMVKETHHLLLYAKDRDDGAYRFLCGQDERGWFAAAVPKPVSNIFDAMEALKPELVTEAQKGLSVKERNRRKNRAFRRQGEWYFIPVPGMNPAERLIIRNEPIRRGAGSPHMVEEIYRTGGENVYVCSMHPNGLTEAEYRKLLRDNPKARVWGWNKMQRNMGVYGRGKVTHRDHRPVTLTGWHRILPNRETESWFIEALAFLD